MLFTGLKSITFEVMLLLPALTNAQLFTVNCQPLTIQRSDPIVNPGGLSGHVHSVIGGTAFQQTMSTTTATTAKLTTCDKPLDKSNYWVPQLYHIRSDNKFEIVEFQGSAVYYLLRACNYAAGKTECESNFNAKAPPAGLRMLAGNPARRTFNASSKADQAISHVCLTNGVGSDTPEMPTLQCLRMRSQVYFPSCWDGINLDSPDHKSHLAYPAFGGYNRGVCPSTHPVAILSVFFEFYFNTAPYTDKNFVWASGDTTGYGFHGDFLNGWDQDALNNATATCQGPNGSNAADCSINGGGASSAKTQTLEVAGPTEEVGLNGPLAKLPGDNPVPASAFNSATTATSASSTSATPSPLSCTGSASNGKNYTASAGGVYVVECGVDYADNNLASQTTSTFEACINFCDTTARCVDVSYVYGACYLKSGLGKSSTTASVWTARKIVSSSTVSSSGASLSTTGTKAATPTALSCTNNQSDGKNYTASAGGLYVIECGREYAGYDLASRSTTSFETCIDACDTTAGCVDVSYVYGACYMKSALGSPMTAARVWTGRLIRKGVIPRTTSSVVTPKATTLLKVAAPVSTSKIS